MPAGASVEWKICWFSVYMGGVEVKFCYFRFWYVPKFAINFFLRLIGFDSCQQRSATRPIVLQFCVWSKEKLIQKQNL